MAVNEFGAEGAEKVAALLSRNSTITYLDVSGNRIGDHGAEAIATALDKNSTIVGLNLQSNYIGDQGAQCIIAAMEKRSTLQVWMSGNSFGTDVQRKLAMLAEKCAEQESHEP